MSGSFTRTSFLCVLAGCVAIAGAACNAGTDAKGPQVSPVYNQETGKLEQLVSDRNGDGRSETRAFMDGAVLKRIEIDRNGDGAPDRWEFYRSAQTAGRGGAGEIPVIERAEEANGAGNAVTRREFYFAGAIHRVEDDADLNGKTDKWEWYEKGELARVELDLVGKGYPSQRLIYGAGGVVSSIETDPDGDGKFVSVPMVR